MLLTQEMGVHHFLPARNYLYTSSSYTIIVVCVTQCVVMTHAVTTNVTYPCVTRTLRERFLHAVGFGVTLPNSEL